MQGLIGRLGDSAAHLVGGAGQALPVADCVTLAGALADRLTDAGARCAGIRLDNGPDWIVADLACTLAGVPCVPIPAFFTPGQVAHVLGASGMDAVFSADDPRQAGFDVFRRSQTVAGLWLAPRRERTVPPDAARVTFTSGTTGTPRGVCLTQAQQDQVATTLAAATEFLGLRRHLSALPLAVLLENVAGVYAALASGADVVVPPLAEVGLRGSSGFDPAVLASAIDRHRPHSLILLPQMLKALVAWARAHDRRFDSLRFVAVGGARTAPELIVAARALGIPAYEGYGLTEACSVVCVNLPGADRPGSVGRPLPHQSVRVGATGEIEVRTGFPVRYLGEDAPRAGWLATGDVGRVDGDGFVHVHGRRKQVIVTSFGRNVSPEWVESELLAEAAVVQAMVFGDDLPALGALLVPAPGATLAALGSAVARANARLPDYARVGGWRAAEPFSPGRGELTANGRPRRDRIAETRNDGIAAIRHDIETTNTGERHGVL